MNPSTAAPTTSAQALTNLNNYAGTMQDPSQILTQQQGQLGLPAAQQQLTGLQGAIANTTKVLNQVAPSVMGRTANSLVTSAQAGKQVQNEEAPISQNLNQENTDYGNQSTNVDKLTTEAEDNANLTEQGQQSKLSYLQGLYNSLYGQESDAAKAAEQEREFNANLTEQQREANMKSSDSGGGDIVFPPSTSAASSLPQGMSLKNASSPAAGYNFNFGGTPVSAAKFAQVNGGDLRNLLYNMGNSGDKTAAAALQALTKTGGKWTPQIQKAFPSIFWGT